MQELHELDSDVVVVDVAGDNRDDLFDFFAAGAARLLVTSREPRALQATYAFLKGAAKRAEGKHGEESRTVLGRFAGGLVGNAIEVMGRAAGAVVAALEAARREQPRVPVGRAGGRGRGEHQSDGQGGRAHADLPNSGPVVRGHDPFERSGEGLTVEALEDGVFLLMSGEPLNEPIAQHGPFLMNTYAEIAQAIDDYQQGKFGHLG